MAVFQKMAPSILSMNVGNILSHKYLIQFEILTYLYYKVSGNFTAASLKSLLTVVDFAASHSS